MNEDPDLSDAEIGRRGQGRPYAGSALQRYHREANEAASARQAYEKAHCLEHAALFASLAATRLIEGKTLRAGLVRFHAGKRRAAKLKRTPAWADVAAIRAIYDRARRLSEETGIPHHVDHVLPLQGGFVSGLHVPENLQIITGAENIAKGNRFSP